MQRLADELVGNGYGRRGLCRGLNRGHIGSVCDAISTAGIDPAVWSARAITDALNADMKARGWSWPDQIQCPAAFFASRLRRLEWRPTGPPQGGRAAAASHEDERAQAPLTAEQSARIAAAKASIRRTIAAQSQRVGGRYVR